MDLIYLFRILLKRKWIILFFSIAAAAITFFLVSSQKEAYRSVAQYSTGFTEEKVRLADGTTAVDLYTADSKFNNVIETFRSPRVVGMLSYRLLLHDLEYPQQAYKMLSEKEKKSAVYQKLKIDTVKAILRQKISLSETLNPISDKIEHDIYEFLKLYGYDYVSLNTTLAIGRVSRTDYLDIVYTSPNAYLSAFVVNTIGTEFLNYYQKLNSLRTEASATNIQSLVNQQQLIVDSLNALLRETRVKQGAIDPISMSKTALETVTDLESQLGTSTSEYNQHKYLLKSYEDELAGLTKPAAQTGTESMQSLMNRKDKLIEDQAKNPDPALQKQIDDLDDKIRNQSGSGGGSPKDKLRVSELNTKIRLERAAMDGSKSTMDLLQARIRFYTGKSNINPGSVVDISALESQLSIENKTLATLKERFSQAEGLVKDDPTVNFKQTLIGQPEVEPVSKKKLLKTALAGAITLSLLSILFIFIELFDSSVKTPLQFDKQVGQRLIGVLNYVSLKKNTVDGLMMQDLEGSKYKKEEFFKNSIRKIRYELERAEKKIFLVTSTREKAGKTTVTESIALSMLLSKKKVLLIDFNFGNNTLTEKFSPIAFIEDLDFTTLKKFDEKTSITRYATSVENLYVIGCKKGTSSPSEVISLRDFETYLHRLAPEFDVILIEGASMNERSDSNELFRLAEGVITVYSAEDSISSSDNKSYNTVKAQEEKNIGTILNKVQLGNVNY